MLRRVVRCKWRHVWSGHSRFLGPIALVVDCCGDGNHNGREEVTRHVVVLLPRVFALEDLHEHEVQLDPLETHPGEGCQEEEVEDPSNDGTSNLTEKKNSQGTANLENMISHSKDGDPKMTRVSLEYFRSFPPAQFFMKPY